MAQTYKTDRFNIPQLPAHAVAVATLTGLARDDAAKPDGFSVYVTSAGTIVGTPLGKDGVSITLTFTDVHIGHVIPFRFKLVAASHTATFVALY